MSSQGAGPYFCFRILFSHYLQVGFFGSNAPQDWCRDVCGVGGRVYSEGRGLVVTVLLRDSKLTEQGKVPQEVGGGGGLNGRMSLLALRK